MKNTYSEYTKARAKRSNCPLNCFKAFIVGGFVCCIGYILVLLYKELGADEKTAQIYSTVSLVFIAGLLTGIGVFDKLGTFAGAGVLVPITGFANSVTAPAIENKSEGFVFGMASKMFVIAGPVIVFGLVSSMIYGIIYWITTLV